MRTGATIRVRCSAAAGVVVLLLSSCVAPALSESAYRSKAAKTAGDAVSAIETIRLALDALVRHELPSNPIDVSLREEEDILASVAGTFSSVQPPTPAMDELRADVLDLLDRAQVWVEDARIAFRRGDFTAAQELVDQAEPYSKALDDIASRFTER